MIQQSKSLLAVAALTGSLLFSGSCKNLTSEDFGTLAEVGAVIAGKEDEAQKIDQAARNIATAFEQIDLEAERSLGGGVALRAVSSIGTLHPNEDLHRYVNLVGLYVSQYGERVDVPYAFAVLENETPNAFAGPGGYVFITSGALRLMDSEAELAGVLAHEIAHIEQKHMLKTYQRARMFTAAVSTAQALEDNIDEYTELIDYSTETLFEKGLDQRFEFNADTEAIRMAAAAGYDPKGLIVFLEKLETVTEYQGGWFKTHPSLSTRVSKLYDFYGTELGAPTGEALGARFEENVRGAL